MAPDKTIPLFSRIGLSSKLDDLDSHQVLPILHPPIEEQPILRFHQLEAAVAILLQPAIDIHQTVRQHPALLLKTFVDLRFCSGSEMLDHHVSLHPRPLRMPANETSRAAVGVVIASTGVKFDQPCFWFCLNFASGSVSILNVWLLVLRQIDRTAENSHSRSKTGAG